MLAPPVNAGKPMFGALKDEHLVLWCAAIYAAVFFCPGDLFYQLVNLKPVYVPIAVLKEIYRFIELSALILPRLELMVYTTSGFAAAQPEMEQKKEGCQHM